MPNWFKKKKDDDDESHLPESLRGKTPEQVDQALKEAADAKARVTALEAERQKEREQVAALNSSFNDVKTRLAAAEANNRQAPTKEEPADWSIDPETAFKQQVTPLVNVTVSNAFMMSKMLAKQSLDSDDANSPSDAKTMNGRLFSAWESEIDNEAKKYPQTSMGNPQAWIGLFYLVKGRHADELANPETRKKKYNFIESGTTQAPPPASKSKDGVDSLTDQELHVADRMGVTPEAYAKRKSKMNFVQG